MTGAKHITHAQVLEDTVIALSTRGLVRCGEDIRHICCCFLVSRLAIEEELYGFVGLLGQLFLRRWRGARRQDREPANACRA